MRVLDAGIWRPVPHATQLLADLGATVVKLEPPGGDPMRHFPELFAGVAGHKRSVVVDLRTDAGRARALDLAARADVFTEGWRPGVAERLGLGWDALHAANPCLIYVSVSGYGRAGPWAATPGHDVNYQAMAGAVAPRASGAVMPPASGAAVPPVPRLPVADLAGGTLAALVVCAAWARRLADGDAFVGERVDVSMTDVVASWVGPRTEVVMRDRPERVPGSAGYGVFRCADGGLVALGVIAEDHLWAAVCEACELRDLAALTYAERLDRVTECNARVAAALAGIATADALDRLARSGAPASPVLTPEQMAAHPLFAQRGLVHRDADGVRIGFPARLDRHPARAPGPPPAPGEHDARDDPWS
jgi:crotonobetainyl-CoA:carnitine CoA-transferase CaiB-like acyl-CoA transferase